VFRSGSATITNLLATSLTVSSGSTLNGGVVVNESGGDNDTRIEGDTDANLLFVDASTDRVCVGTNSLETKFVVSGNATETASLIWNASGSDTDTAALYLSAVATGPALNRTAAIKGIIGTSNNHALAFFTNPDFAAPVERMRITSDGSLGIGTTSPNYQLHATTNIAVGASGFNQQLLLGNNSIQSQLLGTGYTDMSIQALGGNLLVGATSTQLGERVNVTGAGILTQSSAGSNRALLGTFGGSDFVVGTYDNFTMVFRTNNTERARITTAGDVLFGTTSLPSAGSGGSAFRADTQGRRNLYLSTQSTGNNGLIYFLNPNGEVGSITTNGSATSYNTSSDRRLKENISDAADAGEKVDAIQVRQFDWKADGAHQSYGMIAQELMAVAPEAVSGDPESDDMMGVDYSKLVPMLVKEIQSLRKRVAELEVK